MTMWREIYTEEIGKHWARTDGAVVKKIEKLTSKLWSPISRQWYAYAPGADYPLSYQRKDSRFTMSRNFKTAANAMKALDGEFPYQINDAENLEKRV